MSALGLLKKSEQAIHRLLRLGDPAGTRTPDPRLKRQLLYRLSYWVEKTTSWKRTGPHPQNANLARQAVSGAGEYGACGDDVAGMAGLEPADEGVKVPCLTTWLHPCILGNGWGRSRSSGPSASHVGWVKGFEPSTPGTTIRCSNQLSYTHHINVYRWQAARTKLARQKGFEPLAYCLEGSCSIQLSYWRVFGAGDENRTRIPSLEGWCPGHCATPAHGTSPFRRNKPSANK